MIWAGYFGVAEYIAVRSKHHDAPLSTHMRWLLRIGHDRTQRGLGQLIFGAGIVWLIRHIYGDES